MQSRLSHDFEFYLNGDKNLERHSKQIKRLVGGVLLFRGSGFDTSKSRKTVPQILNMTRASNVLPGVALSLSYTFKEPEYLDEFPLLRCHSVNMYSTPANFIFQLKAGIKKAKKIFVFMHPFHKELQKDIQIPEKFLEEFTLLLQENKIIPLISEKHLRKNDATLYYLQFLLSHFNSFVIGSGTAKPFKIGCYPKLIWALKKLNSFWNVEDCVLFLDRKARLGYEDCLHLINNKI